MFQGTGSDVGKSLIVAGLARAFTRRGLRVRPFKPQNMSNNAAVTADGGEIGRAQALQARAAGVAPSIHMNPVLLKPQTEVGAQVVVQGRMVATVKARDYQAWKPRLLEAVLDSFDRLRTQADLILVEGAGSASEVNLRAGDIANMGFARATDTPVVLLGVAVPLAVLAWAMRGETMLGQDIAGFGVLRCVTEFAAGTAVGALWLRWRGDVSARWPMLAAAVGGVALAIGAPEVVDAPATLTALLLALALGAGTPGHVLEGRMVHWLGTISYATYLSHYVLWHAFKLVAVRNVADVPPLSIAIFLALVLAASAFLYTYVEVPAQRWRGLRGWSPKSSPARGGGAPQA